MSSGICPCPTSPSFVSFSEIVFVIFLCSLWAGMSQPVLGNKIWKVVCVFAGQILTNEVFLLTYYIGIGIFVCYLHWKQGRLNKWPGKEIEVTYWRDKNRNCLNLKIHDHMLCTKVVGLFPPLSLVPATHWSKRVIDEWWDWTWARSSDCYSATLCIQSCTSVD